MGCAMQARKVAGSTPQRGHRNFFFIDIILPAAPRIFPGEVRAAGAQG